MSRGARKKRPPPTRIFPGRPRIQIQAVSYSVTREKAPVYTRGSPDVRAFSRNKRGLAGSLIWINFDRHALLNVVRKARGAFIANVDDIRKNLAIRSLADAFETEPKSAP